MAAPYIDQQRLAFGRVAELYERARPAYPPAAIDALIAAGALHAGDRVLEVGAGTGKLTRMLVERGLAVTALEPDAAMAKVARASLATFQALEVHEVAFEQWCGPERVRALVSAQAWHWIEPAARYPHAGGALSSGGTLACIWTFPSWRTTALRDPLCAAYRDGAPGLAPDFPMHPASDPNALAGDWRGEIDASEEFCDPRMAIYPWLLEYSTGEYLELLQTHQDHILLEPGERRLLLGAIANVIDRAGGSFVLDFRTRLCLASRR
jgi:SAM-dependent methyltransferase